MSLNFVIAYNASELYDIAYSQLASSRRARLARYAPSPIRKALERLAFSERARLPMADLVARRLARRRALEIVACAKELDSRGGTCFVLFADQLRYEKHGLCGYIKEEIPDAVIAVYLQDLVSKDANKQWHINRGRSSVDLTISFDRGDAKRYGLAYHLIPYSHVECKPQGEALYDVCFVGRAKDRLGEILSIASKLSAEGLRCFFYITDVAEGDRVDVAGVTYGGPISYSEYLKLVVDSKCLLEIVQGGSSDSTIRLSEAVSFGKLLISNNPNLESNPFYRADQMSSFTCADDLDVSFVRRKNSVFEGGNFKITPEAFLDDLENMLENRC